MRTSRYLLPTLKEIPADAEIVSHQLMLRAGMIRKLAAGVYNWLPLGYRVLRKVETIVREEMDRSGAQELSMPVVQPGELWVESGRWDKYGAGLLRFKDRHARDFCLGPTHEEIITDIVRREIRSYRQLPATFYQIQTKFRDEVRPRFGVMRAREFLMKDAYSFHIDDASLGEVYELMYATYSRIFDRLGLEYRAVEADSGAIGGDTSHEFQVLADSGEDEIAWCNHCDYAANVERAPTPGPGPRPDPGQAMAKVETPVQRTIAEVSALLGIEPAGLLKTLIVAGEDGPVALVLRGDHELNEVKAEKLPLVSAPLRFASDAEVRAAAGCAPGYLGPVDLGIPVIADFAALELADFCCGANQDGFHLTGANWVRDLPLPQVADLRRVRAGDPCPRCEEGQLSLRRGIEVGHIFQLGTLYSQAMNATVQDESGNSVVMPMGCYGIGVSRIVAAAIEQNHDENGILWPEAIAPFQVALIAIGAGRDPQVAETAQKIYAEFMAAGIEILYDDRDERPGVMFANMELIGIPHRLVIGSRGLKAGTLEYKSRRGEQADLPLANALAAFRERLA